MSVIVNTLWKQFLNIHRRRIDWFIKNPYQAQYTELFKILEYARYCEWGKKYSFQDAKDEYDWQQRVPIQDYETLKGDIHRMMKGEKDVLWPGRISYFSKSSGTTNDKSKYIPITDENHKECHVRGGLHLLSILYDKVNDPRVTEGKSILLAGSSSSNLEEFPGSTVGDVSAIILQRTSIITQSRLTPAMNVTLMPDFEKKLEIIANTCCNEDVRMVGGTPTWAIVLFKKLLEITGKKNILEIWPKMEVFVHGAVSFVPYRELFRQFFPSGDFLYQETYNASEGYFAAQYDRYDDDMLLLLDNGVFYEFIPMEEWEKENPKTLILSQVEKGKNYALVITTNSGLYRYKIGDTIMFTSLNPHKIKITGRTKQFINAFGEEVMVSNTDQALAMTCDQFNVKMVDYTVAPIFLSTSGKGGHEWVIEFEQKGVDSNHFAKTLDDNLKKLNSDYEAKRFNDLALECLKLNIAPNGTFLKWLKSRNKIGAQQKVPRLSNTRTILEEVLAQF